MWVLEFYNRIIERWPASEKGYWGRGDAYFINDRLKEATCDYDYAIQLAPSEAELYLARGRVHRANNMQTQAIKDFKQAIKRSKQSPWLGQRNWG